MAQVEQAILLAQDNFIDAEADFRKGDFLNLEHRGIVLYLKLGAVSGTNPTLDCKVSAKAPFTDDYVDIPGASFTQKNADDANSTFSLTIYPGIGETANESISDVLPGVWALTFTVGGTDTPTFNDISITGYLLP